MDLALAFTSVVMGVAEGLARFLPLSPSGHRIVTGQPIGFMPRESGNHVAWASAAGLLHPHFSPTFTAFGWYRIARGLLIAALLVLGVVVWTD